MTEKITIELKECDTDESGVELHIELATSRGGAYIRRTFQSLETVRAEIDSLKNRLEQAQIKAEGFFARLKGPETEKPKEFKVSEDPAENWIQLEALESDNEFIQLFNSLNEQQRRSLADYVLTTQNIFKGKASIFSQYYDEHSCTLNK